MAKLDKLLCDLRDLQSDNLMNCEYVNENSFYRIDQDNRILNCLHINVRSLIKNKSALLSLLDNLQSQNMFVDVLLVCETFLTDLNESLSDLPGYNSYHMKRNNHSGGGVSIFVRDCLSVVKIVPTEFNECSFETISLIVRVGKLSYLVSELYRPPSGNLNNFCQQFNAYLDTLNAEKVTSIIIGTDQNIDMFKLDKRTHTSNFLDHLLHNNLEPCITLPTRITHHSATLIDNIYVKRKLDISVKAVVIEDDISDHFPCLVTLKSRKFSENENNILLVKIKFNEEVYLKINQDLLFENWEVLTELNVNEAYEYLLDCVTKSMDKHARKKVVKVSKLNSFGEPWLSVPILKMNNKCKKLFKKSIGKSPTSLETVKYKEYRKLLVATKRNMKCDFYKKLFGLIGNNSKNLWSVLNGLISKTKNKHSITSICESNSDNVTSDSHKIANIFNEHFSSVGKKVQSKIGKATTNHKKNLNYKYKEQLVFSPVSEIELTKLVDKMQSKTSYGYDHISNQLLKKIFFSIRRPLIVIFNKSLLSGVFPDKMKIARVLPLFKGANSLLCNNYRPISLLPVFSKLPEKLVYKRLTSHMEINDQLFAKQYGFRRNHGCVDAIKTFIGNVLEGFDNAMMCLSIFIDLRKAFDTVNHNVIFDKLSAMGVKDCELSWFESYRSNHSQYVDINGSTSGTNKIEVGVAQGSLLGILLFQLIINDMKNVLKFSSAILYADDTTIYVLGTNPFFLERKLQNDLNRISMRLRSNSLSLNT